MRYHKLVLALFFCGYAFLQPGNLTAQEVQPAETQETVSEDEVTVLDAAEIKVTIETPQVKLYTNRIKPEFDDVHLDKSFVKEITGEGETIVFEALKKNLEKRQIDVNKLTQKLR